MELLSGDCKKKCERGKCSGIDMGLRYAELCRSQECNNSEIVEKDNSEGLSDYKTNSFFIIFHVHTSYTIILAADCFMLLH